MMKMFKITKKNNEKSRSVAAAIQKDNKMFCTQRNLSKSMGGK